MMRSLFGWMRAIAALTLAAGSSLQAQQLLVSPTTITTAYTAGAQNPPPSIDVTILSNGAQVPFAASLIFNSAATGWAFLASPNTSTPGKVTVAFSPQSVPGGLAVGTYTANLNIDAPLATPNRVTVPVTLNVVATSQLSISPTAVSLAGSTGGTTPISTTVTVNSSGSPFAFTTSTAVTSPSGGSWLTVAPASGNTGSQITVSANPTGLAAGTYTGKVTLTSAGIVNSPLDIPVSFTVSAPAQINASPGMLNFNVQTGTSSATPTPQSITLSNTGLQYLATITYQSAAIGWLTVTPVSGATPATLQAAVSTTGLANGVYNAKITLSAPGTAADLQIPVTLTISNAPLINVNPSGLTFTTQQGRSPDTQAITLSSTGAPLVYTFGLTNAPWLILSPITGDNRVFVSPNAAGLGVGTYNGSINVSAPGAGNSPVTVPVTLTVLSVVTVSVAPANLTFTAQAGGSFPALQGLSVTSSDGSAQNFSVKTTTTDGANWLVVDRNDGTTTTSGDPAKVNVLVNQSGLAPGNYTGSITIGIKNTNLSQTIPVSLTVTGSASLTASPANLAFTQPAGGAVPAAQSVQISSNVSGQTFIATTSTSSGGNWLSVTPANGTTTAGTPSTLSVSINANSLATGFYDGNVTVLIPNTSSSVVIPVKLTVGTVSNLTAAPASLNFTYSLNGPAPAAQTIHAASSGNAIALTATAATTPAGGTWLQISPSAGNTPLDVSVSVVTAGLTAGTYTGNVVISGQGASNGAQTVAVTLTVTAPAAPVLTQLVNGATFLATPAVPGLIVTLQGTGMGPATGVTYAVNAQGMVDSTLSGTRVVFDGVFAAPVLYASATQVNAIVPYDLFGRISTGVQVEYQGQRSNTLQLRVDQFSPGIFAQGGSGQGAILNQNFSANAANNPADRGSIIQIFATGEGQTNPPGVNGKIIGSDLRKPLQPVTVRIGGVNAEVTYYGSAPTLVSGAIQVNARVPASIAAGVQPIEISIGGVVSQPNVTVAIR